MSVNESSKVQTSKVQASEGHLETFENVDVPEEYKEKVLSLLQGNADLFAQKDSQLSHTNTVKMKIDTGDQQPIRRRPYHTPLNKRKIIDDAIS